MLKEIQIGDVVKLLSKYEDAAKLALVIEVNKSEFHGDGGWITFDYVILNDSGELLNISRCCIEKVVNTNQSPSTWLH
jgi:hypothetical protein|tara:strand:+ start:1349 stop:1582 length:234 start_codon:yes stop_codon:yes gene_type:complete